MFRQIILSALVAGAAFTASMTLSARVEARPLPIQGVESLAGESNITTVEARSKRVVRSNRTVRRGPAVRSARAPRLAPIQPGYRYRANRGSAIAAGVAVGAVGILAATAAAGSYYDPYYGSGDGYYPNGYSTWGYGSGYYGGGYAPVYYGGYAQPYRGRVYQRRVYRGETIGRGVYRNRGGVYHGGGHGNSYGGGGWNGGLGPMGNMQSNGMPYAR